MVGRHGGIVEKFIGDAVVGVFGVPVAHEDDALRAVARRRPTCCRRSVTSSADLTSRLGIELAVRIGVNTGEVLSDGQALMSGDAANVAARLETAAGVGEVLVGESTYRLVRGSVDAVDVGPLVVKGKPEPLVAFRLVGVGSVRTADAPLLGPAGRPRPSAAVGPGDVRDGRRGVGVRAADRPG